MIILDTNVISALMQREPSAGVMDWLDRQPAETVWTTAITVYELEFGIRILADGQRRRDLERALSEMIGQLLDNRVFAFDVDAARESAELSATQRAAGRPVEIRDVLIAGIARSRKAQIATRNVRHFESTCEVINPWNARDSV